MKILVSTLESQRTMARSFFIVMLTSLYLISCQSVQVIDKPILYDQERKELSLQYMSERYELNPDEPWIDPRMIVVHWTAIPTLQKSYDAFYPTHLPDSRTDITAASSLNVSAHFLVDRDGRIFRLLPEHVMARHTIGLNHCAIGIENVGGTPETPLTKKQLRANIRLIRYLKNKYPGIDYLIGHLEYTRFEGHPLWKEVDDAYRTEKSDPGVEFMQALRKSTQQYQWNPVPQPQ